MANHLIRCGNALVDLEDTTTFNPADLDGIKSAGEGLSPCLIVLAGDEVGQIYRIEKDAIVIGRALDAAIRLEEADISREHVRITREEQHGEVAVTVYDLDSTNGTYVNGERIDHQHLSDGDRLQLGSSTVMKFGFQDSFEQSFQRRQYHSSIEDDLTESYNKRYFMDRLSSEYYFASRHARPLSLAMLDIDHFKVVNDQYGHPAGDQVLKDLVTILKRSIRGDDVVARYGGEEFGVIMREIEAQGAFISMERIRRSVEAHVFRHDEKEIRVTVSVGIATFDMDNPVTDFESLIKQADQYLYRAKELGRNRTESIVVDQ